MPSPILARADALMHRRRQGSDGEDVPVLTDTLEADDDLPVLTDSEAEALPAAPAPTSAQAAPLPANLPPAAELADPAPPAAAADADALARELARRIEQRLLAELPGLIERALREWRAEQATPPVMD